jgi:hypothetical protein
MDRETTSILTILLTFGFIALIVGALIVVMIVGRKREQERTRQLANVANLLDWQFAEAADMSWIPNLERFALFSQGHSKSLKNVMYGELNGMKAALFDYYYVVGHGKHRSTHNQSVAYFEPRQVNLPFFSLRPESTLHKIIRCSVIRILTLAIVPTFRVNTYCARRMNRPFAIALTMRCLVSMK